MDYRRLFYDGVLERIESDAIDQDFYVGDGLADFVLNMEERFKLKEFYQLESPCNWCEQCLGSWLRDEEGREFIRELWRMENEDR